MVWIVKRMLSWAIAFNKGLVQPRLKTNHLIKTYSTRTFVGVFFSTNGRIWVTADIDSANCRIICSPQKIVKTFPKVFHRLSVENLSPSFFRARWSSVLHGNQAAKVVPGTSSDRPLSNAGTLGRLHRAFDGAWWKRSSRPPAQFDRNAGPDSSGLISMEHAVPSPRVRKKKGLGFPTKSQWKTFGKVLTIFCGLQMILQLAESISTVIQILPLVKESPKKES